MLITLILWCILGRGWGIGELEGFFLGSLFCIPLVYSLGASLLFFLVNILLFTDKKIKKNARVADIWDNNREGGVVSSLFKVVE